MKSKLKHLFSWFYFHVCFEHLYVLPIIIDNLRFKRKVKQAYLKMANTEERCLDAVIYMCPKEFPFEAGLTDRFRGIISLYNECKRKGLNFKIYYTSPNLLDYIIPNEYNWLINRDDICFDRQKIKTCYLITYHHDISNQIQMKTQQMALFFFLKGAKKKQIHFYSNTITGDKYYGKLFNELFKPSPLLQAQLEYHLNEIARKGKGFVSISFRMINLLGDFYNEGKELPDNEKELYIQRCVNTIIQLHATCPEKVILVCTDSSTLLERVTVLPYVYTIPGVIIHTGYAKDTSINNSLKTFVDMYMISYAQTVYLVRDSKMYHSGFPYRSSLINSADYKEIPLI